MDSIIFNSILFLGGVGLLFGIGLGIAAKKFAVKLNPKEEEIIGLLPGVNCGACGYPGCSGYAAALINGEAEPGKCTVASKEVNSEIARILGKEVAETDRKVAIILCNGGSNCKDKMDYQGIKDCNIAAAVFGGSKECSSGCLGLGSCAKACPFGAIIQEKPGDVPKIDWNKCTGCGICVSVCPKKIINLVPCKFKFHILCQSNDKGAIVRKICSVGCIGCGLCVKVCPEKDIVLENNLARMKYDNCNNCGLCFAKCPTKSIKEIKLDYSNKISKVS
ncbi:MAG: RnfABCDGE type electron transport complex subunit B [Endomicrobiales bacterium]|nr:RnfABCDGE type electron transport complex subunit B [Endomicrobiales bacterium]